MSEYGYIVRYYLPEINLARDDLSRWAVRVPSEVKTQSLAKIYLGKRLPKVG
jgi:hypothetical protein